MSDLKTFEKWYLKKDYASGKTLLEDGKPVKGEFIRTCRLADDRVKILNADWQDSGVYFFLQEKKAETVNDLDELREKAKNLGIKGYQIMKEETLLKKIEEAE